MLRGSSVPWLASRSSRSGGVQPYVLLGLSHDGLRREAVLADLATDRPGEDAGLQRRLARAGQQRRRGYLALASSDCPSSSAIAPVVIPCVEFLLPSPAVGERVDGWNG